MNAEILSVGTELLMGQILNSNAQYISSRLPEAGVNLFFQSVVGDNPERLKTALKMALERSDTVIMTGGLGPTQDDLTKETVCEVMGIKLIVHQPTLSRIENYFSRINKTMVDSNKKQALIPENSIIIENSNGTAPGCIIEQDDKIVILLPGPPKEMVPMFDEAVLPYLKEKSNVKIDSIFVKIFGMGESLVESMIEDLIGDSEKVTLATYAKDGEVTVRITSKVNLSENSAPILNPVLDEFKKRFGDSIYSVDNSSLEKTVAEMLMDEKISFALAESCTGGLLSSMLTDISGISSVFAGSVVSYSNKAKIDNLSVHPDTIAKFGAVSEETASEMAKGARKVFGSDIGVSITGVAGPTGGTAEKPVGLVYVALADSSCVVAKKLNLNGDRNRIRKLSAMYALDMIRKYIVKNKDKQQ